MIVLCKDGFYYRNPTWEADRLMVRAELEVDVWYVYHRPVLYRALMSKISKLVGSHGLHTADGTFTVAGDMTKMLVKEKMQTVFHTTMVIIGQPRPPQSFEGKFEIRPADFEDEIIDDYSIPGIKARRERWSNERA